jgi:hypothetical protein
VKAPRGAALVLFGALVLAPRDAGAVEAQDWGVIGLAVFGGGALLASDTVILSVDAYFAGRRQVPDTGYAVFEGAFGGLQVGLGAYAAWLLRHDRGDDAAGVLALTSLPLAVSMHGLWTGTTAYDGFPWAALPVAALDATILGWDVAQMAGAHRQETFLAWAELFGAMPKLVFTGVAAGAGRKEDVATTLAFGGLPALLVAHAIYTLADQSLKSGDIGAAGADRGLATWTVVPTVSGAGRAGGGLSVVGAF